MKTLTLALFLAGLLVACDLSTFTLELDPPECDVPWPIYDWRDPPTDSVTFKLGCPFAYVDQNGDTILAPNPWPELP